MRSLLIALLGGWITGSLILGAVATQNFRTIDRLLSAPRPEFASAVAPLDQGQARTVLRHLSSELNRRYFSAWGLIQLALGVVVVIGALGLTPMDRAGVIGAAGILVLVVVLVALNWLIVPLGRGLDFLPRNPAPPSLPRFGRLHLAYTSLDALKLILCAWLLVRWTCRANRISLKR
ncbi:MAG: hypothetical protein L0191_13455 [Acidobacteria bacterium]|nr:hypothetical protein [Acidobacteriota bacterium]